MATTLYRRVADIVLLLLMIGILAYLSIDSAVWQALAIVKPGH
jgi:hypothetical protein